MRGLVSSIHSISDEFTTYAVDFLTVYILEAHAEDEWPISSARYSPNGQPVRFNQHKTLEERIEAARKFQQDFDYRVQMCVDPIENPFEKAYAPWPIRFFIVEKEVNSTDAKVSFVAFPRKAAYDISVLRRWLLSKFSIPGDL